MIRWKDSAAASCARPSNRGAARIAALLSGGIFVWAPPAMAQDEAGPRIEVKPGAGAVIEDEGRFKVRIGGRFQLRETLREDDGTTEMETLLRRVRLAFDGYVFDESLTYKFEFGFAPNDLDSSGAPVLDAYIRWKAGRDLELQVGQSKVPFERQRETSSSKLQFVDRSQTVGSFQIDRDLGITLRSDDLFGLDGRLGYRLGVYGGEGRGRTTAPVGFLYLARAEVRPFGSFADYEEADLSRSPKPRLAIGGSVAWNEDAIRARGNRGGSLIDVEGFEGFDYLHLGADAVFKWHGLSVLGEILWQQAQDDPFEGPTGELLEPHEGWGWFVQAGQLIGPRWEVAARYGEQRTDETGSALAFDFGDRGRELGAVVNWYLEGHPLKVQADYFRYWGVDTDGVESRSFGDAINEVRLQLQMSF